MTPRIRLELAYSRLALLDAIVEPTAEDLAQHDALEATITELEAQLRDQLAPPTDDDFEGPVDFKARAAGDER